MVLDQNWSKINQKSILFFLQLRWQVVNPLVVERGGIAIVTVKSLDHLPHLIQNQDLNWSEILVKQVDF